MYFYSALVVIDNMNDSPITENVLSSEESTIDVMSNSGDEEIDITNDLDPPESSENYITDVNHSVTESAKEYLPSFYVLVDFMTLHFFLNLLISNLLCF